jgi:hypothetical protein
MNTDPIYLALRNLLEIKKAVSYFEVASVAGVKRKVALEAIVANKHLLGMDEKGRVTRFATDKMLRERKAALAYARGEVYTTHDVNYGSDKEIKVADAFKEKIIDLEIPYCVGGLGDNYWTRYVIVSEKTCDEMRKRGFIPYDEYLEKLTDKVEDAWISTIRSAP